MSALAVSDLANDDDSTPAKGDPSLAGWIQDEHRFDVGMLQREMLLRGLTVAGMSGLSGLGRSVIERARTGQRLEDRTVTKIVAALAQKPRVQL